MGWLVWCLLLQLVKPQPSGKSTAQYSLNCTEISYMFETVNAMCQLAISSCLL